MCWHGVRKRENLSPEQVDRSVGVGDWRPGTEETVVACVVLPGSSGKQPRKQIRTFKTMTADDLELADWLAAERVSRVALKSTGVYWKPIWNVLERSFTLLLVNARRIKQVPGRKTDVARDVLGFSGRRMLAARVARNSDAASLADLAVGRLRSKLPHLERALTGQVGSHPR
jgi:hypothetical protein